MDEVITNRFKFNTNRWTDESNTNRCDELGNVDQNKPNTNRGKADDGQGRKADDRRSPNDV